MVSAIGAAFAYLRRAGFRPAVAVRGTRAFDGTLTCQRGSVRVQLLISDWDFVDYPVIRLLERPDFLPAVSPHIFGTNGLCYFRQGSIILDRYRPDVALAQCLEQAREVLDRLSSDPAFLTAEFESDFGATWSVGQLPLPMSVLLGHVAASSDRARCYVLDNLNYVLVTDQPSEAEGLCKVRGWPQPTPGATCWVIRTSAKPTLPPEGLPATIGTMFTWIRTWGRDVNQRVQAILGDRECLAFSMAVFLVHTPAGWFGFSFEVDATKKIAYQRRPTDYRQYLHQRGRDQSVQRLSVSEVGADFVHSRNLEFPSLKNKHVKLIGCGAIGGYLGQALAKLGAGSGPEGKLDLIDPDQITAGNLGRHYLGFDSLFVNKAEALEAALHRQFPGLTITACPRAADFAKDLSADLVVNATGEEALSEALNYYQQLVPTDRRSPLLHAWIVGNGQCVQALWVDKPKFACYRCLRQTDDNRTPRFEPLSSSAKIRRIGCNAYTPYAVAAPMAAAALAMDMIAAWLQEGDPAPRFRTRAVEGQDVRVIKNQNVSPLSDCPACSPTRSA